MTWENGKRPTRAEKSLKTEEGGMK